MRKACYLGSAALWVRFVNFGSADQWANRFTVTVDTLVGSEVERLGQNKIQTEAIDKYSRIHTSFPSEMFIKSFSY